MAAANIPFGPGELTIGEVGTEIDVSCLVNSMQLVPSKDQGDPKTKLCGDVVAGAVSYTWALSGNVDQDNAVAAGFAAFCYENRGTTQTFTFTPNTAAGASATGQLVVDPLTFGGEEFGEDMVSDIEFSVVGDPTITFGTGATMAASEAA